MRVVEIVIDVSIFAWYMRQFLTFFRVINRTPSVRSYLAGLFTSETSANPKLTRHRDESFNSITGLNGSGKSNILDAICFVLGITNLSTVRAQNLQVGFKRCCDFVAS
jgi:AAA15 family ATPase/GTPase